MQKPQSNTSNGTITGLREGGSGAQAPRASDSQTRPLAQIPPYAQKTTVVATRIVRMNGKQDGSSANEELSYEGLQAVGQGSFGTVYSARLCINNQKVAIKKVLQDRRFKNRELSIMKRMSHANVVKLLYYFYTCGSRTQDSEVYLNLVMDFVPENVYKQVRALNYIHKDNICHRDIKPQNLLCNPATGVLKLCDFGSAKQLDPSESNVSYICSRYYRAPELILCAMHYTCAIDVWSCGCVLGELLLNQPLFPGETGVDQLVEIIKILGTPSREQTDDMNPEANKNFHFPLVRSHPWSRVFRNRTPQSALDLANVILEFSPQKRIKSVVALAHPFFNELRDSNQTLPNGQPLPMKELYHFTVEECSTLVDAKTAWNGGSGKEMPNIFGTPIFNGGTSTTGNTEEVARGVALDDQASTTTPSQTIAPSDTQHNNTLNTTVADASTSNSDSLETTDARQEAENKTMIEKYIKFLQGNIAVPTTHEYDSVNIRSSVLSSSGQNTNSQQQPQSSNGTAN